MPRIASAKSSSSKSVAPAHAPAPISHFPAPTPFTYSVPRPTLGQSIKDGFGLGIGSSIARNMVDGFFHKSPEQSKVTPVISSGTSVATEYQKKEYIQCMQTINDHDHCKKLIEEPS
jgi:hypothetical protein